MTNEQKVQIQNFQLTSDIFFGIALENIKACQEVICIITGKEIILKEVRSQKTILQLVNHSIRIDIWAEDILGRQIGIEMHPQSNEDRVKRNRYNIASIDVKTLKAGEQYGELPDTYGIYITQADFLKTQKGINKIVRYVDHSGRKAPNGITECYVSLACEGDTPAQTELINYMKNSDGIMENSYFPNLVKQVRLLKEEKQGGEIMCEIMDKLIREGELRGEARGEARGIVLMLKTLNYETEDIVSNLITLLGMTDEKAREYV